MLKVVGDVVREVESRLAVLSLNVFEMGTGGQRRQAEYQGQHSKGLTMNDCIVLVRGGGLLSLPDELCPRFPLLSLLARCCSANFSTTRFRLPLRFR
jgi:hypothetical protein